MAAPMMAPPTIAPKIAAPSPWSAEAGLGVKAKAVAAARVRAVILVFMMRSSKRVEVVFHPVGRRPRAVYSFFRRENRTPRKWLKISLLMGGCWVGLAHARGGSLQEFQGPARRRGPARAFQPRARAQWQRQDEPHPGAAAAAHAGGAAVGGGSGSVRGHGGRTGNRVHVCGTVAGYSRDARLQYRRTRVQSPRVRCSARRRSAPRAAAAEIAVHPRLPVRSLR